MPAARVPVALVPGVPYCFALCCLPRVSVAAEYGRLALCVLLCRLGILCLLVCRGLGLVLLLMLWLLLRRLVLLLCRFGLLFLSVLFLAFLLPRVRGSRGSEKHEQYCCSDWQFHVSPQFESSTGTMQSVETPHFIVCLEWHRFHLGVNPDRRHGSAFSGLVL